MVNFCFRGNEAAISIHLLNRALANDFKCRREALGAKTGMAFLYYLVACIVATGLHEMAHVSAAWALGISIKRIGMNWKGPYIVREQGPPFANLCIALAGPVLNVALAFSFWTFARQFAVVNLALGAYNLLPFIRGLDGCHALAAYRQLRGARGSGRPPEPAPSGSVYSAVVSPKPVA